MSESQPNSPTRGDLHRQHQQQQQLHQSSPQHNAVDERDDANNSIIGKVKSRVSSIFPEKLTKWFSPSSATSSTNSNGGVGRRRRRNEEHNTEVHDGRANDSDDESNNSAEDGEDVSPTATQPPTKRSRLNVEVTGTNFKDSQSFLSSTPTTVGRRRTTHLNLYGKQKEPAYNFTKTTITTNTSRSVLTTKNSTADSADIIEVVPDRSQLNTSLSSSRRSLNIPSTSSTERYRNLHDLNRQPMSSLRTSGTYSAASSLYTPHRTSTTILEVEDDDDDNDAEQEPVSQTIIVEEVEDDEDEDADDDDNEESEEIAKVTSKKQKFTNGNLVGRSSSVATESGESRSSSVAQSAPPKSGMFNRSNRGLRTLSGNGLNFYSHLEGRKSLFSEKNMPGMLNSSTLSLTSLNRRQFNSSIYGSTSALSDSRLLNTSSPFYKGQTTYGGAAAYNKFNRALNQSVRIAPTLIRPTSSLSTLSSSTNSLVQGNDQSNSNISSTAKRILELINDFSTPLNDAKKMASNIKTPAMLASRTPTGKRFSEADLATSRGVRLSTVRTPYTRPTVTLNPSGSESKKLLPPLKELQVPTMSQLLQMKRMQSCTERSRQIANTSKSALNLKCEYKLPGVDSKTSGDKNSNKHVSKIKNKVTASSRVSSKNVNTETEEAPPPANLPNIAFPFMPTCPKFDIPVKSSPVVGSAKSNFKFELPTETKLSNRVSAGFGSKSAAEVETSSPAPSKPEVNFSFGTTNKISTHIATSSEFKFSSPLKLNNSPPNGDIDAINNFKFSLPVMVGGHKKHDKASIAVSGTSTSVSPPTAVPQLKKGSVLDALKKPIEKVAPILASVANNQTTSSTAGPLPAGISLFGGQFKKPSNEWECSACMVRNKDTVDKCVACTTPRTQKVPSSSSSSLPLTNSLVKNTFGDAFKPKADTWECSACMVRNKSEANECVACNTKKPGAAPISVVCPKINQSLDHGFKSLASQQSASKWECDACMTRNDNERNKCVCCEQAKPGTQVVSESVPKFNFGTSSASKFTFGFAGAKKEDELKAEAAKNSDNKPGFTFGIPAVKNDVVTTSSTNPIVFGVNPLTNSTSSTNPGKDVPDVVKTNATSFKFGIQPAESSKAKAGTTPATGFSFGVKLDNKPSSVKFNLPTTTTTDNSKTSSTVCSTSAITSSSSSSTTVTSLFTQKVEETKTPSAETSKPTSAFVFGAPASVSVLTPVSTAITSSQSSALNPITFGSGSMSEANKSPSKVMFGNPTTTSATSSFSTTAPTSGFIFGKATASSEEIPKSTSTGFAFGKDQTSSAPSFFAMPASSSTSLVSKGTTLIFGSPAATTNAPSAVLSSPKAGFVFGSPSTTSMFGANPIASTTATTSLFGSKPASVFSSPNTVLSSTQASSISSTPAQNASTSATIVSSTPFVFGSGMNTNASQNTKLLFGSSSFDSGSAAVASTTTAASSWPTNTFTFGSSKLPEEAKSSASPAPAFGSPASLFGQAGTLFGQPKPTLAAQPAAPTFGSQPGTTTSLFGSNATPTLSGPGSAQQTTGNVFGSTSSTPAFGSVSFRPNPAAAAPVAAVNSNSAAPTSFGSMGSSSFTSGFGSLAAASSAGSGGDGASAPKKPEPAFNFGSAQNAGNSGFSFGSSNNNNKPAPESVFKFTTSSAPSFNFTGITAEPSNATHPFQFGAPTNTPTIFNFGGVEGTNSSGPFQFNAAAPAAATNNIFAPMPTPGSQAVSQQARRKMRTTIRRATPRTNKSEQNISDSSSRNRSRKVSDGNGGDDDHHDSKDDTKTNNKNNNDEALSLDNKEEQRYQTNAHQVKYLTTDNAKTGDESTKTTYSSIHSIYKKINSDPVQHYKNPYDHEKTIARISREHKYVRPTRRLPFKKFALTTYVRGNLVRNQAYQDGKTSFTNHSGIARIFQAHAKQLIKPVVNQTPLAQDKTGKCDAFLAKNTSTTNSATITNSHQDPAKFKYVKKSQGN